LYSGVKKRGAISRCQCYAAQIILKNRFRTLASAHRNRKAKGNRTRVLTGTPLIFPGYEAHFLRGVQIALVRYSSATRLEMEGR
jgi:hypothetical protein